MEAFFLKSATRKDQYPSEDLPQIAFAGRSNVGKSSLINSLLNRKKLAKTSSTPGRTQAINFFNVENRWIFTDLPGYGFAKAPKAVRASWGPMIEEFFAESSKLKLAILIVDARHKPTVLDKVMRDYLLDYAIPFQLVATKVDKLSKNRLQQALKLLRTEMETTTVLPYSSTAGTGRKELWRVIREVEHYG